MLSTKLHRLRRKLPETLVFNGEQLRLIVRHKPESQECLKLSCNLTDAQIESYGERLLKITKAHVRDQEQFMECVFEIRAFVNGGRVGMAFLNKVYTRIISHYGMDSELYDILSVAGVRMDVEKGKLKRV